MLKGLGQIASIVKNAQEIQGRMKELQDRLRRLSVEGSAGGGMVSVEMNGQQQVVACRIDPNAFASGDREMLEDLIVAACHQAQEKVKQVTALEMEKMAGGLDLGAMNEALAQIGLTGTGGRT